MSAEQCGNMMTYSGGCHCGAVRFQVKAAPVLKVIDCNCSICKKKQNKHFIVPLCDFQLLQGEDQLTTYTFNSHIAKHQFCRVCGVQSFYRPRSNPDGYGVMPHCLDGNVTVEEETFDGEHWETSVANHRDLKERSKPK